MKFMTTPASIITATATITLLLQACSKKPTDPIPTSAYKSLPDLPVAAYADAISGEQTHIIEVQLTDQGWRVQGGEATVNLISLEKQLQSQKDKWRETGYHPYVLIEADKNSSVQTIIDIIKAAKRGGIDHLLLAVKSNLEKRNEINRMIHIILPMAVGCGGEAIQSLEISLKRNNSIQINKNENKEIIEKDPNLRNLPHLRNRISPYLIAVRSTGKTPLISLSISPDSSYQRMIDIFNLFHQQHIHSILINFSDSYDDQHGSHLIISPKLH